MKHRPLASLGWWYEAEAPITMPCRPIVAGIASRQFVHGACDDRNLWTIVPPSAAEAHPAHPRRSVHAAMVTTGGNSQQQIAAAAGEQEGCGRLQPEH